MSDETPTNGNGKTTAAERRERFVTWNPYASDASVDLGETNLAERQIDATLAVAYEISQLRSEIHFASKRR